MESEYDTQTLGTRIRKTGRKIFLVIFGIFFIFGMMAFSFYYWGVYDEGVRAGIVLRISKKGVVFKTYEGQLNLETFGALKGTSPIMESFNFSVEKNNEEVIRQLEAVALSGERINLHYIKRYKIFPWRGDTKYFATRVERLQKQTSPSRPTD